MQSPFQRDRHAIFPVDIRGVGVLLEPVFSELFVVKYLFCSMGFSTFHSAEQVAVLHFTAAGLAFT
jgi:hypothetical protein